MVNNKHEIEFKDEWQPPAAEPQANGELVARVGAALEGHIEANQYIGSGYDLANIAISEISKAAAPLTQAIINRAGDIISLTRDDEIKAWAAEIIEYANRAALQANNPLLELVEIIEDDAEPMVGDLIQNLEAGLINTFPVTPYFFERAQRHWTPEVWRKYVIIQRNGKPAIKRSKLKGGV